MKTQFCKSCLVLGLSLAFLSGVSRAAPQEPTASPDFRPLRDGYVKTWYIYNDRNLNGILDPGDEKIAAFDNWWTPVSAHTQHNYEDGPYDRTGFMYAPGEDMTSGPMNFAHLTDATKNYWLPMEENSIAFYMTYTQFDNNDFATFYQGKLPSSSLRTLLTQRNMNRNGWALGWVTNTIKKDADGLVISDQTAAGQVAMDIYVHNGRGELQIDGFGASRSNPNVAMSNDISPLAHHDNQWHPPTFDEASQTYKSGSLANLAYKDVLGLTEGQFAEIVGSMEVREWNPDDIQNQISVIYPGRTPAEILSHLVDHSGAPYRYDDAFTDRGIYVRAASDGGVIAGLAGQTGYDPGINNWGDQQVIRIDFSPETFLGGQLGANGNPSVGNITRVVFYDFGYNPGAGQITPVQIVLDLWNTNLFPEHRFYIAQVEMVPEPVTFSLLAVGAVGLIAKRRRA
ncbi:MAG TPA: PEP-CTERM sorting domain-containing protein [Phycisphaerae bacterium]|nr:PEP-CTERM sorting domain-containing protein [Phycisphaerae bacterium]